MVANLLPRYKKKNLYGVERHKGARVDFAEESLISFRSEVESLLQQHWDKAVINKNYNLKPDWNSYYKLQESGAVKIYTVRHNGLLVGYASVYTVKSLYAANRLEAHYDMIYICPDYRKGRVAVKFIEYIEKQLVEMGVKQIVIGSLRHQPFDSLLDYLNYKYTEKIYTKYIG